MNDPVNAPSHYIAGDYECSKVARAIIEEYNIPAWQACLWYSAWQYLWRYSKKNGTQDLDKALLYIRWLRESMMENEEEEGVCETCRWCVDDECVAPQEHISTQNFDDCWEAR